VNILFLTTHLNTGGISIYIKTLAREFRQRGHRIFIVSSGGDMEDEIARIGVEHFIFNIRTKSEISPKIYLALKKLNRLIKEKNIEIIHAQTRVTQVMGTLAAKMTGRVFLSTCHGYFKPRLVRRIFPCWGKTVIAISEPVVQHLTKDFKINKQRIALISNGLDIRDFPIIDDNTRQQRHREFDLNDSPVIGIIARLSEVKGHSILIKAMNLIIQKFPKAVLLIIGQGNMENSLKQMVGELNLQNNVRFLPIVNQTSAVLGLMDIFVMPSLQEGLGLAVMEAQASGLPVVASRVGGLPSLIEDGKTGLLVRPNDSQELAVAIVKLLKDPAKAKALGLSARKFIEKEFSSIKMAEDTLRVYQHLLLKNQ